MAVVSFTDYTPVPRYDDQAWTIARIEEAATIDGPWSLIQAFALDPVDADPAAPMSRSFTTELATLDDGWYRLVWVDPDANESAADPQQRPADSFATTDEFAARLNLTFDDDERIRAQLLLQLATRLIQDEANGQRIVLVKNDMITMPGRSDQRIVLPQRPVVSVASITLDGDPLVEGNDWYLDDAGVITRLRVPVVYANTAAFFDGPIGQLHGFGFPSQTLQIVYTHGFSAVPGLYKGICLEACVRVWVNPGSVIEERIGDVETTYAPYADPPRGLLLTDNEIRRIRKQQGKRMRGLWIG